MAMVGRSKPENVESCVLCRRHPVDPAWRPFCSERCRLQDLACWAGESYRVPGGPVDNVTMNNVDSVEEAEAETVAQVKKVTDPDG
jgi:uncharacterized protein